MTPGSAARSSTRDYHATGKVLESLSPGDGIVIRKVLRINSLHAWTHEVEGVYTHYDHLCTGLATDREPSDDIVLVCVHFKKPNGELGTVVLDDQTQIEKK